MNPLSRLRRWQIVASVIVLVIVIAGALFLLRNAMSSDTAELEEDQQLVAVRRGDLVNEISVSGSVSFPERDNLTFGSQGVVSEVLVTEGERVSAGDVIARLDAETIARLEREVTEANAALRDAQDEMDDLVNPPELSVAEARQAVALAQDALDEATETIDEILTPTDVQVTDMAGRVAAAARAFEEAEDALADVVTPSDLDVANAARGVVEAEIALEDLQDSPTSLEVANATDRVTNAEVALQDAVEALERYEAGVNDDDAARDLNSARQDLETARTNLANAMTDYEVSRRDGEVSTGSAQEELDEAGQAYADTFAKWLGIVMPHDSLDPDYDVELAVHGIDLAALFTTSNRGRGLAFGETIPIDNPNTAWNESQIHVWLHFSRVDFEATCDRTDIPPLGTVCIEDEFRSTGEAYQDAIDSRARADANALNAIADAQARIDSSQLAIEAAEDRIEELTEPVDPVVLAKMQSAVLVAEEELNDAKESLADLKDPTDRLEIASGLRDLEVAQATLADARERHAELTESRNSAEIADLTAKVEAARANLEDLKSQQAELTSGQERPDYPAAFHAVEVARLTLEQRQEVLDDLLKDPDPVDLDLLTAKLEAAQTLLEESEERLADASGLRAPSDGFVSRVNAEEGEDIEANDVVAVLVDTGVVEVDGSVDEIDVLAIEIGVDAEVKMDALPDQIILGKVSFVGAEANDEQGVVSYPVRVEIELPPDMKAPEGLSAVATIVLSRETDVLLIPVNAIRGTFDNPVVHLMVDEVSVETPVTLGNSDDFWTIVTGGLSEGDMVVALAPEGQDVEFFSEEEGDNGGPRRGE